MREVPPIQLYEYLLLKGYNLIGKMHCINPDHPDRNPSMQYDPKRDKVHCFSCTADYDIYDVVGILEGIESFKEQKERVAKYAAEQKKEGLLEPRTYPAREKIEHNPAEIEQRQDLQEQERQNIDNYIRSSHEFVTETNYFLKRRGLNKHIVNKYKLGFDPKTNQAVIPIGEDYYLRRQTKSNIAPKYVNMKNREIPIFNACHITPEVSPESIFYVTEGVFDALSLETLGQPAISLNGVPNTIKFVELLKENKPAANYVIVMDNDEAGVRAAKEITDRVRDIDLPVNIYTRSLPDTFKDANDILITDKTLLINWIQETNNDVAREITRKAEKRYTEYLKRASLKEYEREELDGVIASFGENGISTGFAALDNRLDGGLYEGLYIIGGISSLGKTTYALQIAEQIARQKKDVIIFSLEQSKLELICKMLSKISKDNCAKTAKTARDIMIGSRYKYYPAEDLDAICSARKTLREYTEHIFIEEGIGDVGVTRVKERIEEHISITGRAPVVIVDYLQILAPANIRATDKQNIDRNITELKKISRDYRLPLIGISSLNRASYNTRISMESFKESGSIEYSSDVLIGLQYQMLGEVNNDALEAARKQDPRRIEAVILKNRNGKIGNSILMEYFSQYNFMRETSK